ncbi:SPOCS domain-containing protein [Natroniella sp. ANB-PHB2]|uniref:DUF3794 and LysM peptidoglycan-binding domain-containing protein n=1 Tax=Natroniella sp. ANB-PHB2 TaxID=3384444 RepID=UPI0038D46349
MAINFKQETVKVDYVIGEDTVRESITREVEIPVDQKPDIERILEVDTSIRNVTTEAEDGGAVLEGVIDVGVIYVADAPEEDPQQPVHYFEGTIEFTNFIDIPEAEEGMAAFGDVNIIRATYDFVDERTVEVTVVIRKFAKVTDLRQITIVTDVKGIKEDLIERELLRIESVIAEDLEQIIVRGTLDVPPEKPPVERVLKVDLDLVDEIQVDVTDDGVIVDGTFEGGIVYVSTEEDQSVHFAEGVIEFSEVIDLPGVEPDMAAFVDIFLKRFDFRLRNEGTVVEVEALVEFFTKVTQPKQIKVITDILDDRVEIEEELLRVEEVIGEDTVVDTVTEQLIVPNGKPDIERVLEANAQLRDPMGRVEDGGVAIEATIQGKVLYVADLEEQPVHFFKDDFDFTNFVGIPGAEVGMSSYIDVRLKRVRATQLNQRTVEMTATLVKFAKVTDFRQITIVTDLVVVSPIVDDPVCDRPSRVVYVVQPGDTLYKIAKRYRSTVAAIVDANDIVNPDQLQVGQKLVIPKCIIDDPKEPPKPPLG